MSYPPVKCRCSSGCCSRFCKSLGKARREIPIVFELLLAVSILCSLLILDIVWLGHVHTLEIGELDELHANDLNRFRKQYDVQMHEIGNQQKQIGSDLEAAHSDEVNRLKLSQQQELEKKISNIQEQLNSLLGMSKHYWEKHAEKHRVDIGFQPPKLQDDADNDV
ncbi:unnamed protein product [Clavelina lepadiformis]|uniref:Uncharacterized protein n=1 Tax=Clavelina lepadiformis TaxID=159417 RepID=A0ABP0EYL8_CLALP